MERLRGQDTPIEEVWSNMREFDRELRRLFRRPHSFIPFLYHLPPVALFNTGRISDPNSDIDPSEVLASSFEIYPKSQTYFDQAWFVAARMIREGSVACYVNNLGFFYDRRIFADQAKYNSILVEETTHHVVFFGNEGLIPVTREDLFGFQGIKRYQWSSYAEFLALAAASLELVGDVEGLNINLNLHIEEFFPPIAQAFIFKGDYLRYAGDETASNFVPHPLTEDMTMKEILLQAYGIKRHIKHLPEYAGHLLVMKYNGDAESLMKDNPHLTHISGAELWETVVKPILVNGL